MYEMNFVCRCIKACWDFDTVEGNIYPGVAVFDKNGSVTFVIEVYTESPIKCVQEWFENYFELIPADK